MIFHNWLMGEGAVLKILALNKAFKANRVRAASKFYGEHIKKYHPILGHPTVYKNIDLQSVSSLILEKNSIDFQAERLKKLKQAYESINYLLPFHEDYGEVKVNDRLIRSIPECEKEFRDAIFLINENLPWMYKVFERVNEEVCPILVRGEARCSLSFTDYHVIGVIFCGLKPEPNAIFELAVCLSHELAHNVLHLYQAGQSPIAEESYHEEVYSGIRKTNRPVFGSLHAAVALGYMLSFCRGYILNSRSGEFYDHACLRAKELEGSLGKGLEALGTIKFNELGLEIYKELKRLLI